MTVELFLHDSYLRECDAKVLNIKNDKYVVLDRTIFYPKGGGQPHDVGKILKDKEKFQVVYAGKFSGEISHEIDQTGLAIGDSVRCILDWDRRYKLMRSHTASHTLASILFKETGALITGNQLETEKVRFDFSLKDFDPETFKHYIEKANELFQNDIPVQSYELAREEALKIPGIVKMAEAFPPEIEKLRIVEITGVDSQADGGTHVKKLEEVGQIQFIKAENKGKNNRRVYFRLIP